MRRMILGAVAVMSTVAATGLVVVSANADAVSDDPINLGYYARWYAVGGPDDFFIKDLHESGAAGDMTHLAYAFANISPEGDCDPQTDWGDYTWSVPAADSVDGVADSDDQALAGQFNQLRKLKELNPDLHVTISLGGGDGVDSPGGGEAFKELAADPQTRAAFVENCVDTFLRGNLPVSSHMHDPNAPERGGPGSAAGVFDGIDIDWEWPDAESRDDFTALHQEFRQALDELGDEIGKHYWLNTTVPGFVDSDNAGFDVPAVFDAVDFTTIQGYNMYGAWNDDHLTTNHHAQLYDGPDNPGTSNSTAAGIEYLIDAGASADKIVLGVPSFARGWTGVPDIDNGLYQIGSGPADGSDGSAEDYHVVKNLPGTTFVDEVAVAAYHYDGNDWWSYDVPETVAVKTQYSIDNGLGGMMIWDTRGDMYNDLISTIADTQAAA